MGPGVNSIFLHSAVLKRSRFLPDQLGISASRNEITQSDLGVRSGSGTPGPFPTTLSGSLVRPVRSRRFEYLPVWSERFPVSRSGSHAEIALSDFVSEADMPA